MEEEEGKWRLLNALSIRFSQPRIAPHFRDGHLLDETVAEVGVEPLEQVPADVDDDPSESAEGPPAYDVVLIPPFPAIRVISWLPKIRRPNGEAARDENGDQILGKRAWFALDNRRLHSLQCAAAKRWPQRCCVVVRCIEEVPSTTAKELRKFRTTSEGRSIEVGVRAGETRQWSWLSDAPPGARAEDLSEEGFYSEDLWDARQWAPRAVAAASAGTAVDSPTLPSAEATPSPPVPGMRGPRSRQVCAESTGRGQMARLAPVPQTGWEYVDPAGRVQGPFPLEKMRLWHQHGYFYPDLPMRSNSSDAFKPFAELFPAPLVPFRDTVKRVPATNMR